MPSTKMGSHMDPQLVEKIVHEVKSQGAFDEFRKDSMADVDTKPAYQNLRQRVENTVKKFLAEQRWTPETNKYQLRERLRKYITESGFLDVGVERIVDQVVNPKIGSVFQPRIEEIAYKFLGVPPPQIKCEPPPPIMPPLPPLPLNGAALKVETCSLLPTDLEQVSPDSDKATLKSECKDEEQSTTDMELDDKMPDDDDESPPFEPLVKCVSPVKVEAYSKNVHRDSDMETSNDCPPLKLECIAQSSEVPNGGTCQAVDTETQYSTVSTNMADLDSEKEASRSFDVDVAASQESQLSQVSSDSRISTATPTASHSFIENSCVPQLEMKQAEAQAHAQALEVAAVNISEEAQMPKFNENSNDGNIDGKLMVSQLHFDIKKDEIKFEGTERKTNIIQREGGNERDNRDENMAATTKNGDAEKTDDPHQFVSVSAEVEHTPAATPTLSTTPTPNAQESSFGSSLEDVSNQQYLERSGVPNEAVVPSSRAQPLESKDTSSAVRGHSSSSSSSRHKKHSKDKRRSHDNKDKHKSKEREKERERERSGDNGRHSRSKHAPTGGSSSHSKRSSSSVGTQPNATSNGGKSEKTATSKHATSASSSSSSSRSECHDGKRDKRDGDRKHQRADSAIKKSDRKSEAVIDDHNLAKEKTQRRKSTDSNDEDKSAGGVNGANGNGALHQPHRTSSSTQSSKSKPKNESGNGSGHSTKYTRNEGKVRTETANANIEDAVDQVDIDANANECLSQQRRNKVVILNDILQNPSTNFIALASSATCMNHVQVVRNVNATAATDKEDSVVEDSVGGVTADKSDSDLLFLEEESGQFTTRLRLLDHAMDRCRRVVNNLRFDCAAGGSESLHEPLGTPPESNEPTGASLMLVEDVAVGAQVQAKATLTIECMTSYGDDDASDAVCGALMARSEGDAVRVTNEYRNSQVLRRKRLKRDDNCVHDKPSPTPSEASINSKENEVFEKNADESKQHKLSQQRYTSEDLYKPRPILSQRSRRRGVDSII